jgi:(1->4)-alpha-D-glucan 1-alpha-D-glucosylmutase
LARDLTGHWQSGAIKLYLIWKAIRHRREHEDLFRDGEFMPLEASGKHSRHVLSFMRKHPGDASLVVIPRWLSQISGPVANGEAETDWQDTKIVLPADCPARWKNIVTGQTIVAERTGGGSSIAAGQVFHDFPVAFLSAVD